LQRNRAGKPVEVWLGISTDEWQRAKDADAKYIAHRFPLLELGMSRQDCMDWLLAHGLPNPGKSSCVFCPFMTKAGWQDMRERGGRDWVRAVEVDALVRDVRPPGQLFVHQNRVPLGEAVRPAESIDTQADLLAVADEDAACDSGHCFL
jgi:hypothetical protein